MQIILTQEELGRAAHEYALQQISIQEGQIVTVRIETTDDGGAIGIVDITKVGSEPSGGGGTKIKAPEVAKPRGKKATAAAEQVAADVKEDETQAREEASVDANIAGETAGERAPWVEPTTEVVAETQPNEVPATNALKIFPDASTSAPVMERQPEPVNNGKSLFANLIKPTNH